MNTPKKTTLFLERKSYRQRRLRDAVRMLPVFGIVLWFIPVMWTQGGETSTTNADAMLFIFGGWMLLIVLCGVITRAMRTDDDGA